MITNSSNNRNSARGAGFILKSVPMNKRTDRFDMRMYSLHILLLFFGIVDVDIFSRMWFTKSVLFFSDSNLLKL